MDRTTADITDIRVPGEDGVIVQAMGRLDEGLAAWTSAMREACRQVAASVAARTASAVESPLPATPLVTAPIETHVESAAPVAAEPQGQVMTSPEPVVLPPTPVEVTSETVAVEPAQPPSPADDDETLLTSLDPETAKMIRVMRRLSTERKSVREWIKEVETNKSAQQPAAQPKKKSWFSRG